MGAIVADFHGVGIDLETNYLLMSAVATLKSESDLSLKMVKKRPSGPTVEAVLKDERRLNSFPEEKNSNSGLVGMV